MVEFVCLFTPSFLAVAVLAGLQKRKPDLSYIVLAYGSFTAAINLCAFFILSYVFNNSGYLMNAASFTNGFTVKYLVMAVVLAIVLPFIFEMIRRNFSVSFSLKPFSERRGKKDANQTEDMNAHDE